MSVEPLVIAGLIEEESPKKAFQAGVTKNDFQIYDEEFEWLVGRFERRKPVTRRVFLERFPDFEYVRPREPLDNLIDELKAEKAYSSVMALVESVSETLLPETAVDTAEHMREVLADVVKLYSPHSDISMKASQDHLERVSQNRSLAKAGQTVGMPLLIPSIDYYFDGCCPGRLIACLARPGHGKSYFLAWVAWIAIKTGYLTGLFSPEMNEFEHRCRIHTLASADPVVQKEVGLTTSFNNRDLMRGTGFNMKSYKRLVEYIESLPGDCKLFTKKYRKERLTAQYIGSRVEDLGLHGVLIDPISKIYAGVKRNENAVWESYDKVHALQEIVEEYNIFAIATNWSTRQQGRSKSEKAPDLDDSFGSDALAQESDHVIGLRHDDEDKTLTFRCSKSRFGKPTFTATIDFNPNTGKWEEVNIPHEVMAYRLSLNGHASPNGTAPLKRKVIKAKKMVGVK